MKKKSFIVRLPTENLVTKGMSMLLMFGKKFEMKTMKDYHNLYLKYDVLLLVDVFGKFRNNNIKIYGFCPSHYLIVLGLNWNPIIKKIKIKLETIPGSDMYILFEKGTSRITQ